ncbi:15204_t:CDS:2 [Rhizophagus irregularis]|nr:15204_t:CDS:2 [Rhizophagus irregularis]
MRFYNSITHSSGTIQFRPHENERTSASYCEEIFPLPLSVSSLQKGGGHYVV